MPTGFDVRQLHNRPDPLRSYNFHVRIGPGGMFKYLELGMDVESVGLPFMAFEPEGSYRAGSEAYFAGIRKMGNLNIRFYVDENLGVLRDLLQWRAMIQNEDGTYHTPYPHAAGGGSGGYKKTIAVDILDHKKDPTATIMYYGVFPTQFQSMDFDYSKSENPKITEPFSVDDIKIEFKKVPNISSNGGGTIGDLISGFGNGTFL